MLVTLEEAGLVSLSADVPPRIHPAPPQLAIEALIWRQREGVERARTHAAQLSERYHDARTTSEVAQYIEIVSGRGAFQQRFEQLQRGAKHELWSLTKPPYAISFDDAEATEGEVLAAGLKMRVIYERQAIEESGGYQRVTRYLTEGEEARVLPSLPMKLAVADRELALVPLETDRPGVAPAVLIYPSALLDALCELFEALWQRAAPIGVDSVGSALVQTEVLSEREQAVLQLLQAGLTDSAIARQLAVTERTVNRSVRDLMDRAGTDTRFQLGWRAGELGWLGGPRRP